MSQVDELFVAGEGFQILIFRGKAEAARVPLGVGRAVAKGVLVEANVVKEVQVIEGFELAEVHGLYRTIAPSFVKEPPRLVDLIEVFQVVLSPKGIEISKLHRRPEMTAIVGGPEIITDEGKCRPYLSGSPGISVRSSS